MLTAPESNEVNVEEFPQLARKRGCFRLTAIALIVIATLFGAAYGYYRYSYPYGWTHSCDKQLYFALSNYAADHNGQFPTGQPTAEACLSLLHLEPYRCNADLLSGKNVDPKIAERVLSIGALLDPETCGWHYVPGLSLKDDPRLALFWDKPGLGHNGQRLNGGGHVVWFITGDRRHVLAVEWDSFVAEQERLRQNARDVD